MLTTSRYYAEWQFYLYLAACVGFLIVLGTIGWKFAQRAENKKAQFDPDAIADFAFNHTMLMAVMCSYLVLIWISAGRFFYLYGFCTVLVGLGSVFIRRMILKLLGLDTIDMSRRILVMRQFVHPVAMGIILLIIVAISSVLTWYIIYKIIALRYSAVPADQASLEMLLWAFAVPALVTGSLLLVANAIIVARAATDSFVRIQLFVEGIFIVAGIAIAFMLPYVEFGPDVVGRVSNFLGNISNLYIVIGGIFALLVVAPFIAGVVASNAQTEEIFDKAEAWLSSLTKVFEGAAKSQLRIERGIDAVIEAPRMIGELIKDEIYLSAYWLWRYPDIVKELQTFSQEAPTAPADSALTIEPQRWDADDRLVAGPAAQGASNEIAPTPYPGSRSGRRDLSIQDNHNPFVGTADPEVLTARMRVEVQRSLGYLWGAKSAIYNAQITQHGKRFEAEAAALRRWNPRIVLVEGYTEIMQHTHEPERVLDLIDLLRNQIELSRSEKPRLLLRGLTFSTISGGLMSGAIELLKVLYK